MQATTETGTDRWKCEKLEEENSVNLERSFDEVAFSTYHIKTYSHLPGGSLTTPLIWSQAATGERKAKEFPNLVTT